MTVLEGIRTLSIQLAIFVSAGSIRADELSFGVRSRMDIGEFEPMIIPEMPGMPDEFPRLQINTSNGYRLTMSRSRIDFYLELPLGIDDVDIEGFITSCRSLVSIISEKDFVLSRIGFVRTYFVSNVRADFLMSSLMSIPSDGITDVSVSFTQKILCANKQSNSVFAFSTGQNQIGEFGVVMNRDVNTDPVVHSAFGGGDILDYIIEASLLVGVDSLKEFIKVQ